MTRETLREWRIGRKMTQVEAAELLGVSRQAWAHWERGSREIPAMLETLIYLVETYAPVKRALMKINKLREQGRDIVTLKPHRPSRLSIAA